MIKARNSHQFQPRLKTQSLRIISGSLKGQSISSPCSSGTHPMGSREKLALFNMINHLIPQAKVLDVFAGSGALGFEAFSRGAKEVIFVEQNLKVANVIKLNLHKLAAHQPELMSRVKIFPESLQKFESRLEFQQKFDLILADPPYGHFVPTKLHNLSQLLNASGYLVLSFPAQLDPPALPDLLITTTRRYAAAGIAIYTRDSLD